MNSSFKSIFKTSGAASLGQLLNIANQLALVPIYIKVWGPHLYGEWLILSAAPSVIAMAGDLGFGTVAANEMSIAVAKNNSSYALKVFQNNWLVISIFSILFFLISSALLQFLPVNTLLNINQISISESRTILELFLINLLLMQQSNLLLGALRSEGNFVAGLTIGNISRVVELCLIAFFLTYYQAPPIVIALTLFATNILAAATNRLVLRLKSPWIQYGIKHYSPAIIKEQAPIALSYLSFPVTQAFSIQGAIILVGYLLGPTYVAIFSTTRTFMNTVKQAVNVVNYSVWPELTTAYGQQNLPKLQTIVVRAVQAVFLCIIAFNLSIWLVGKPIYLFWTKHKLAFDDSFFYCFAIVTSISALWNCFGVVQEATSQTKKFALYNLSSIIILLSGIAIMSKFLGLTGILLAMLLAEVFMLFCVTQNSLSILQFESITAFLRDFSKVKLRKLNVE